MNKMYIKGNVNFSWTYIMWIFSSLSHLQQVEKKA